MGNNYYSFERFSDHLVIFNEGYSMVHRFVIGVVIGSEKVLVIDAGLGMTDELRSRIEAIVGKDKPILCVCTHNHPDNVGAALRFDKAYCSKLDCTQEMNDISFSNAERLRRLWVYGLESKIVRDDALSNMIDNNACEFEDIRDGQIFDLGGVRIEAIALPGHTKGSMAFWNREEGYVFTGDAVNTDVHLEHLNRKELAAYAEVMDRFISLVGENVTIYPAHLPLEMDIHVAESVRDACLEVANGKTWGDPPGETIFLEEQNNPAIRMHFVHNTCIVYNREKLDCAEVMDA